MICVELLRAVVTAFRKPRLSQGGFTQATAFGEKSTPLMTTGWLNEELGGELGFHATRPASTVVMTGTGLLNLD